MCDGTDSAIGVRASKQVTKTFQSTYGQNSDVKGHASVIGNVSAKRDDLGRALRVNEGREVQMEGKAKDMV